MEELGNYLHLSGVISQSPTYGHEVFGEKFYYATLSVPRLSGAEDLLPITLSERLMEGVPLELGAPLAACYAWRASCAATTRSSRARDGC